LIGECKGKRTVSFRDPGWVSFSPPGHVAAVVVPSATAHAAPAVPRTAVLDGTRLQQTKLSLDRGDPQLRRALSQ